MRTLNDLIVNITEEEIPLSTLYGYSKPQMLLTSDRITINSRSDDIFLSSLKDIHIGTQRHLTISTNKNLIIEANKTFLGDPNKETNKDKMQPLVLGDALFDIFDELFSILEATTSNQYFPLQLAHLFSL